MFQIGATKIWRVWRKIHRFTWGTMKYSRSGEIVSYSRCRRAHASRRRLREAPTQEVRNGMAQLLPVLLETFCSKPFAFGG
jgi:hypothetical protein